MPACPAAPAAPQEYWYHIEDRLFAGPSYFDDAALGSFHVGLLVLPVAVIKHTPKGVRLVDGRFVCHSWTKKYAHPTIEDAKASFLARKNRQLAIHQARLAQASRAIALVQRGEVEKIMQKLPKDLRP